MINYFNLKVITSTLAHLTCDFLTSLVQITTQIWEVYEDKHTDQCEPLVRGMRLD